MIINVQEIYSRRKGLDEPAVFNTTSVVKKWKGYLQKDTPMVVPMVVPAAAPTSAIEEGILIKDSMPARVPTPVPARMLTLLVVEEQLISSMPELSPVLALVLAPMPPLVQVATPSQFYYRREHHSPEHYSGVAIAAYLVSAPFLRSYKEAVSRSDRTKWEQAMDKELQSI